jgi:hypothetical protein
MTMTTTLQQAQIQPLDAIRILRTAIQGMASMFGKTEVGQQALNLTESIAESQAPSTIMSIATNHDAMIILMQDVTEEQKIMAVDAHVRRQVIAALAPQAACAPP